MLRELEGLIQEAYAVLGDMLGADSDQLRAILGRMEEEIDEALWQEEE